MRLMVVPLIRLVGLLATYAVPTQALYAEDAGLLDFSVHTAGHGPVTTAAAAARGILVSSDGAFDAFGTSCYLAGRSLVDGKLMWRRNVCSEEGVTSGYRVAMGKDAVATVDRAGLLQVWETLTGSLLWEAKIDLKDPLVWFPNKTGEKEVAVGEKSSNTRTFYTQNGLESDTGGSAFSSKPETASRTGKIEAVCAENSAKVSYTKEEGFSTSFQSDFVLPPLDSVNLILMTECAATGASFFIATERGTSVLLQVSGGKGVIQWSAEEGLGAIDAAVLIDSSSTVENVDQVLGEELLSVPSRLQSQVKDILSLFSVGTAELGRDQFFGFVKVAVMLSNRVNRLYGMDTASENRSSLRYQIDLPNAKWHKLIRGSTNAVSSVHGIGGGTHARDILVVSYSDEQGGIYWKCLDGTSGVESGSDFVKLAAPVAQIIPLASHSSCRQSAALILEDRSVVFLPNDASTQRGALEHLKSSPNGFYSHIIDRQKGMIESVLVHPEESTASILSIGTTSFPEETIVAVAYPNREETIQSPSNALGDQSLLLKYINPHLFVVVTTSDAPADPYNSLLKKNKEQKRKPAGVTPTSETSPAAGTEDVPNLFVNVVDSVSGRVIHRASHANASTQTTPKVVISENWIIYTFLNERTRRTEIGVLSLYEGMIDNKGLTAFSTPERSTSFSSMDAKEAKPVVLAKTYSMVKAITAVGVSATGGGISGRRLFVATLSGQIFAIDRKMLETRRPLSKLKDSEKQEGLHQYDELIPAVSQMSLSHSSRVEGVQGIVSCAADLESQTLLLAFGGPDLFYARTSPSRGFDLLPDSFNRVLLSIVVTGLVVVLLVIQMRVSKKIKAQGWI